MDILKLIWQHVSDKTPIDSDGWTPLDHAAYNGRLNTYEWIASNLNSINPRNEDGWTPLDLAAKRGHLKLCDYILANIEEKNPSNRWGQTALHSAAKNGHLEVYKLISELSDDKNPPQNDGQTPLHFASAMGRYFITFTIFTEFSMKLFSQCTQYYYSIYLAACQRVKDLSSQKHSWYRQES